MKMLFTPNSTIKKATLVGLAFAVVIGMSYFSSSDYLNQSIMEMLMGGTFTCATGCGDETRCKAYKTKGTKGNCDGCSTYTSSNPLELDGWLTPTCNVTYTKTDDTTVTEENVTATKPTGKHTRVIDYTTDYDAFKKDYKSKNGIKSWESGYELHHVTPRFMGGSNDASNGELLTSDAHSKITTYHNKYTSYCKNTVYKVK